MSDGEFAERPANGWTTDTLGAICRFGGGSIQTGPFGSQLHAEDYKEDGTPIITVEHLKEGKIAHENLPLVGKDDCRRLQRYKLSRGDLVFSRVGAIDRCAYVSMAENGWLFSGRCRPCLNYSSLRLCVSPKIEFHAKAQSRKVLSPLDLERDSK